MVSSLLKQAAGILRKKKENRRWRQAVLCLSVLVVAGTLGVLMLTGQAMTRKVKTLKCQLEVHAHADGCYNEEGMLTCGYADFVVHIHNDDCYDADGNLVCPLEQIESHEHTDACYEEQEILICEEAEVEGIDGHIHEDACYEETETVVCELEEHTHGEECYSKTEVCGLEESEPVVEIQTREVPVAAETEEGTEGDSGEAAGVEIIEEEVVVDPGHTHSEECYESTFVCEKEEHTHGEECYNIDKVLVCQEAEGESVSGHTHTEECYETERVQICGELELHIHNQARMEDGGCYDDSAFDEESGEFIEGSLPVCELLQLEEHTHTADCFEIVEVTDEEEDTAHIHEESCYDEEGNLICGLEEPAHVHEESCYDEEGNLICGLEEPVHVHEEGCYDEEGNLICGLEETAHVHEESCYDEEGNLICGLEELAHVHEESCYDEEGNLICGLEETAHVHNESCYDEEGNLICGLEETAHEHDEECYDEEGNLTCGYEDARDHEHDGACYDENGYVTCGYKGVKIHEHDGTCYDEEGNITCGYEGVKAHEHDANCYDIFQNLICGYEDVADHEHTESCYDEEGNLICGYEVLEAYEFSKTFTCDSYIVVARYNADANIPEETELLVEQITADSDGEHYESREAEYREMMGNADASMRALLKIGFYNENGEEIEPETPVTVAVQFLDADGLAEGSPITVVHFAEEGTEKLNGSKAKNNSTTFKMESFSEIAIGYSQEEKSQVEEDGTVHISNSFEQEADPFRIIFHVEGDAKPVKGEDDQENLSEGEQEDALPVWPEEEPVQPENEGSGEESAFPETEVESEESVEPEEDASTDGDDEEAEVLESIDGTDNGDGTGDGSADEGLGNETVANTTKAAVDSKLKFHVEFLEEGSELYDAVRKYVGESDETVTRRILQALTYSMTYGDVELDLSECTVTAEIIPDDTLLDEVKELAGDDDETAYSLMALGVTEDIPQDIRVKKLDDVEIGEMPEGDTPEDAGEEGTLDDVDLEEKPDNGAPEETADDEAEEGSDVAGSEEGAISTESVSSQMFKMTVPLESNVMAIADESTANPTFLVQYYAYAQIMEDREGYGSTSVNIIDTVREGQAGILNGAQLPDNNGMPRTRKMYLESAGVGPYTADWPVFNPVYKDKDSVDSLTKIYTADLYEYKEAAGGLEHINKFAKDGLNYDLYEVWVLNDKAKADSMDKNDWTVYSGADIEKLVFHNNDAAVEGKISVHITRDTVIRLVGRSNEEVNKNYPARFFDYDFTNGSIEEGDARYRKGINDPANYVNTGYTANYGFGNNNSGSTGLEEDTLPGGTKYINYINQAKRLRATEKSPNTIIEKCYFGLVESELSSTGYPKIKADAPDLFNPQNQNVRGRTEITGYSLNFDRDGDTYTLTSVAGSGQHAQNLNQFQRSAVKAWGTEPGDPVFTNQFWPMDNAPTWGDTANRHDPKFGTQSIYEDYHLINSDDGQLHNSFFGMTFEVEFELTDDYVGPLNYYFFGDDDMWVFLEYPDHTTKLICDIGGVHQAAGEYVDLWNYIQKPEDNVENRDNNSNADESDKEEDRVNPKYKLKFFYTERGASGSTCWMQFTLPSVNAVPVIDYTGNVKSTLTMGKTVEGEPTDQRFDFTIEFSGDAANIASNDYPYRIKNADGSFVESGDIRSGGTFKLGHGQTIEVFNLPDNTKYVIKEHAEGFEPGLGTGSTGTITKDETVEGNIDWDRDDQLDYINHPVPYKLPETGGPGTRDYTRMGALLTLLAVISCFGYFRRKSMRGDE
ncbi:MAG: hypothetical protein HFI33_09090 [Lachnospiraceae bacterium]|nr:hypothetical protein [Lachnospiraceae bacterium]